MQCNNHVCAKPVGENDSYTSCSLCRTPVYCSEECRVQDWSVHNCANVIDVAQLNDAVFMPYHYEDMLPEDEWKQLDHNDPVFQAYSVRHVDANGLISHAIVGDEAVAFSQSGDFMGRGDTPPAELMGKQYTIRVLTAATDNASFTPLGSIITGVIPEDMIYLENKSNPAAAKLSGKGLSGMFGAGGLGRRFRKLSGKLLFWPAPKAVENAGISLPIAGGRIRVELSVAGATTPVYIQGAYRLKNSGETTEFGRSVMKLFQLQLKTKFAKSGEKGIQVSPKDVQVWKAFDLRGNQLNLAFLVNPGESMAQLVDVEFMVGKDKLKGMEEPIQSRDWTQVKYACNPKDPNQLFGLCMAIDEQVKEAPGQDKHLERCAAVIRKYALHGEGDLKEVDTAIRYALDTRFNDIGLFAKAKYRKKIGQSRGSLDEARKAVDEVSARLDAARSGNQKNPLVKLRKSKARSDANDLLEILKEEKTKPYEGSIRVQWVALYEELDKKIAKQD